MTKKIEILALDFSSLAYRSFYALPESIKDENGNPVNCIKGYLDATSRLIEIYKPKTVIHALDFDWRPNWRVKLLPQYKTHRLIDDNSEEVPDSLYDQMEILPQILEDLGMQTLGKNNYEADDILASIAHQNGNCVVATGDRDLFQVINDKKNILVHIFGKDGGKIYNSKSLLENYGVLPEQYVDFAVLRGDPSDGLPGVKGIGEKTATQIINEFKNIENLLKCVSITKKLSAKQKDNILSSVSYIRNAQKVVKLKNDINLKFKNFSKNDNLFEIWKHLRIQNQLQKFN